MDRGISGRCFSGGFGARGSAVFLGCVGVALTLGIVAPSASPGLSFAGPRTYSTGFDPQSIALGDLNRDGKQDLAVANSGSRTVSVLTNSGEGRFRRRDYRTGKFPASVAIGDVNGDRKPDLAVANVHSNTVSVLENIGGGNFRRRDYGTGSSPTSVAIGDLNGDGKPDLAVANSVSNSVSVLENAGAAASQRRSIISQDPTPSQ